MTDSEIVKDLEHHIEYTERMQRQYATIHLSKLKSVLDLIYLLQTEIEMMGKEIADLSEELDTKEEYGWDEEK